MTCDEFTNRLQRIAERELWLSGEMTQHAAHCARCRLQWNKHVVLERTIPVWSNSLPAVDLCDRVIAPCESGYRAASGGPARGRGFLRSWPAIRGAVCSLRHFRVCARAGRGLCAVHTRRTPRLDLRTNRSAIRTLGAGSAPAPRRTQSNGKSIQP